MKLLTLFLKRTYSRKILLLGILLGFCSLAACSVHNPSAPASEKITTTLQKQKQEKGYETMIITLTIDEQKIPVSWEENEAVLALKEELSKQPLTINLSAYGGFEQVGELGITLPSQNAQQTAQSGDIMLYNSSNLVLFYGPNRWSYTKLGHMEMAVKDLLDKDHVTVTLYLEEVND